MAMTPKKQVVDENLPTAQQQFAKGQDIREIHRVAKGQNFAPGTLRSLVQGRSQAKPIWGYIPTGDWQDYTQTVDEVRRQFRMLPGPTRDFFNHDVSQLLSFIQNPANLAQCVKMKLVACPDGYRLNTRGELVPESPKFVLEDEKSNSMQKADDEANPSFKNPPKTGEKGGAT